MRLLLGWAQWVALGYFGLLHVAYLGLDLLAVLRIRKYVTAQATAALPRPFVGLEPPVTVLVPAHDEADSIVASVQALLQLAYPSYEVVVVDDGSQDGTLAALDAAFDLVPFPEAYRVRVPTAAVRGVYRSRRQPALRVLQKEQGGKADALNAGLNAARYPLVCGIDADSVLQRDSLQRVVQPFLDDPRTVAAGGTVRVVNGCTVRDGFIEQVRPPRSWLARVQAVEYLRAFLFGRLGWSPLNALLVISGAFGVFRKEAVVEAGGWRHGTVGEDMDLVMRLHRHLRAARVPFRITFVPDPVCWTEVPEDFRTLGRQRMRWQRGLAESLAANRALAASRRGGVAGWVAYPFQLLFECLGPVLEVGGYLLFVGGALTGHVEPSAAVAFVWLAVGLGLVLSVSAVLLEELSFAVYPRARHVAVLLVAALVENLGYRQLVSVWRLVGLVRWVLRTPGSWGQMRRVPDAWREPTAA